MFKVIIITAAKIVRTWHTGNCKPHTTAYFLKTTRKYKMQSAVHLQIIKNKSNAALKPFLS